MITLNAHSTLIKEIEMLESGELDSKLPTLWEELQKYVSICMISIFSCTQSVFKYIKEVYLQAFALLRLFYYRELSLKHPSGKVESIKLAPSSPCIAAETVNPTPAPTVHLVTPPPKASSLSLSSDAQIQSPGIIVTSIMCVCVRVHVKEGHQQLFSPQPNASPFLHSGDCRAQQKGYLVSWLP